MMKTEVVIGSYFAADSKIHAMDPRVKIIWMMVSIVMTMISGHLATDGLLAVVWLMITMSAGIPIGKMGRGIRRMLLILLIGTCYHMVSTPGRVIVDLHYFQITKEGLLMTVHRMSQFILVILYSTLLTATTTPAKLTSGFERLLRPLRHFKIPVHEIALTMSLALRFIPVLMEEARRVIRAQSARGADFHTGSLMKRGKALVPVLIPLFVSAFQKADELAMAMEIRCYHGGEGRTGLNPLRYAKTDWIAYGFLALVAGVFIVVKQCF